MHKCLCPFIFFLLLLSFNASYVNAKVDESNIIQQEKIIKVINVNEFKLSNGQIIKLYETSLEGLKMYIDSFKMGIKKDDFEISPAYFEGESIESFYNKNIKLLEESLVNKKIKLYIVDNDQYVVYENNQDPVSLNERLLQQGIIQLNNNLVGNLIDEKLKNSETLAKNQKNGIWDIKLITKYTINPAVSKNNNIYNIVMTIGFLISIILFVIILIIKKMKSASLTLFYKWNILYILSSFLIIDNLKVLILFILYNIIIFILSTTLFVLFIIKKLYMD